MCPFTLWKSWCLFISNLFPLIYVLLASDFKYISCNQYVMFSTPLIFCESEWSLELGEKSKSEKQFSPALPHYLKLKSEREVPRDIFPLKTILSPREQQGLPPWERYQEKDTALREQSKISRRRKRQLSESRARYQGGRREKSCNFKVPLTGNLIPLGAAALAPPLQLPPLPEAAATSLPSTSQPSSTSW